MEFGTEDLLRLIVRMVGRRREDGERRGRVSWGHQWGGGVGREHGGRGTADVGRRRGGVQTGEVRLGEFAGLEVFHVPLALEGVDVVEVGQEGAGRLLGLNGGGGGGRRPELELRVGGGADDDRRRMLRARAGQDDRRLDVGAVPRTQHHRLAVDVGRRRVEAGAVDRREGRRHGRTCRVGGRRFAVLHRDPSVVHVLRLQRTCDSGQTSSLRLVHID